MDTLSQYLKAIMQKTTSTVLEALSHRAGLRTAASTVGITAAKLHRVRRALNSETESYIAAIDEVRQRAAKRDGAALISSGPNVMFADTLTPAFEIDPTKVDAMNLELIPIYTAEIVIRAPLFTPSDAGWIRVPDSLSDAQCALFGQAMDAFTEKDLAA